MSTYKLSKKEKTVAQDILRELQDQYRELKANSGMNLFYGLRDYITQTYLTEDDGNDNT